MRLFKPTYIDREGKRQRCEKWYLDFNTADGIRHKLPLFADKRACEGVARTIEECISCKVGGIAFEPQLQRKLDVLPTRILKRLSEFGLLDNARVEGSKPLTEHLKDWKQSLLSNGCTPKYGELKTNRVKTIFHRCGFQTFADISGSKIQLEIAKIKRTVLRRIKGELVICEIGSASAQTKGYYLKACRQFARWMVQDRRAGENPLQYLKPQNNIEQTYRRRALEPYEVMLLLEATEAAGPRFGMDGYQKALLYRLAIESGLRAGELRSLTVFSFDFQANTVTVRPEDTKNRKGATLPLRADTAERLKSFLAGKLPNTKTFCLPNPGNMSRMIRSDLVAAGIEPKNDRGIVDFHSLRHTFGTLLAAAGVHPKTAQTLMRHSDINLTMSRYTHTLIGQESRAVESLPDFSKLARQSQKKTGTDDKNVLATSCATSLPTSCVLGRTLVDYSGLNISKTGIAENSDIASKTAILSEKQGKSVMRVVGIGPTTYGLKGRCSTY